MKLTRETPELIKPIFLEWDDYSKILSENSYFAGKVKLKAENLCDLTNTLEIKFDEVVDWFKPYIIESNNYYIDLSGIALNDIKRMLEIECGDLYAVLSVNIKASLKKLSVFIHGWPIKIKSTSRKDKLSDLYIKSIKVLNNAKVGHVDPVGLSRAAKNFHEIKCIQEYNQCVDKIKNNDFSYEVMLFFCKIFIDLNDLESLKFMLDKLDSELIDKNFKHFLIELFYLFKLDCNSVRANKLYKDNIDNYIHENVDFEFIGVFSFVVYYVSDFKFARNTIRKIGLSSIISNNLEYAVLAVKLFSLEEEFLEIVENTIFRNDLKNNFSYRPPELAKNIANLIDFDAEKLIINNVSSSLSVHLLFYSKKWDDLNKYINSIVAQSNTSADFLLLADLCNSIGNRIDAKKYLLECVKYTLPKVSNNTYDWKRVDYNALVELLSGFGMHEELSNIGFRITPKNRNFETCFDLYHFYSSALDLNKSKKYAYDILKICNYNDVEEFLDCIDVWFDVGDHRVLNILLNRAVDKVSIFYDHYFIDFLRAIVDAGWFERVEEIIKGYIEFQDSISSKHAVDMKNHCIIIFDILDVVDFCSKRINKKELCMIGLEKAINAFERSPVKGIDAASRIIDSLVALGCFEEAKKYKFYLK
jgi:hypothetical protein